LLPCPGHLYRIDGTASALAKRTRRFNPPERGLIAIWWRGPVSGWILQPDLFELKAKSYQACWPWLKIVYANP
jgi:hypothetical protein